MIEYIQAHNRENIRNHIENNLSEIETQDYFKENVHHYSEFYLHRQANRNTIMNELEKNTTQEERIIKQIQEERTIINLKMDMAIEENEKQ